VLLLHTPGATVAATTIWDGLLAWQFEPLTLLPLLVVGLFYLRGRGHRAIRSNSGGHDSRGDALFLAGWLAAVVALLSPVHTFSEELFAVHMVQHLLLTSVAVPLLLLANPLPTVLWGFRPRARAAIGRALAQSAPPRRVLAWLTQPLVAWSLFTLTIWLWHQPPWYGAALENDLLHHLQHLCFVLAAALFWWPVIGPAPLRSRLSYPARLLYVFATWLPNSLLGAGITFAPTVLYPFYAARPRHWGLDPLFDQQLAGLIMWVPGDLIFAAAMLLLLVAALNQEDRRAARSAAAS
jgi:putative membrane protein